jgi:outer membrane cobalamin receptor
VSHAAASRAARLSLCLALGVLALGEPDVASGAPVCAVPPNGPGGAPSTWAVPLDRLVSFHAFQISLREALDRLAAAGRVRFSYSPELLPLDHVVCASFDSVPIGVVLTAVLDGTAVQPVVAGDHVVLTPARSDQGPVNTQPIALDRIVVTGSAAGGSERSMALALNVLDGQDLAQRPVTTLSQALDQAVPGIWLWEQSPSSILAGYGSIRGASSFGLSYPKVYIDGIEVANPLLVSQVIPDAIERIEVIRGPQGAVLYGADAISGVTNIVTRIESADGGAPQAGLESGVGVSNTAFSSSPVLRQDYLLKVRAGSNTRSASLNLTAGEDGAFVPGAYARRLALHGSARTVGSRTILASTLRVFAERTALPTSPLVTVPSPAPSPQSVTEYTAGTTLKFVPNDRWTHSVVAGVDGYTLSGVQDGQTPIPTATDSALRAARGSATRGTLRLSSVARVDLGAHASADVTLAADQSVLHQSTAPILTVGEHTTTSPQVSTWRSISGISALASATLMQHLFLSGGIRGERASTAGSATIPTAGAAWAVDRGPLTVKVRAAYGEGIRWPEVTPRQTLWEDLRPAAAPVTLSPERQSGVEAGADVILARTVTLQVTRFDQIASGLIQPVAIRSDTSHGSSGASGGEGGSGSGRSAGPAIAYQFQNVGEIANRGWEIQGSVAHGALTLAGTCSFVDSKVRQVAAGYTGDLAAGDRMLGVPARMMSATLSWARSGWSSSFTAYRAEDWINYDRVALARAFAADTTHVTPLVGRGLRPFWITYPGVTHLRATASWFIHRGLALRLTGDNLLNRQTGEPDNITVLPGRTLTLGVHSDF